MTTELVFDNVPFHSIKLDVSGGILRRVALCGARGAHLPDPDSSMASAAERQLRLYFSGKLKRFDLPLDFSGYSAFASAVLKALQTVPFGQTVSYGALAVMAGRPGAALAVGRVVGANRTPIIIPCHRVIGSTGKLVGYSATGGLETKRWLLEFEQKNVESG